MVDNNNQAKWLETHKDLWLEQRKFMWSDEMIEKIVGWTNIRPGITVLDVGCGAGFLGRTYWQYFKDGGHYIGADISTELCGDAKKAAKDWSDNGTTYFAAGDAHILPFKDNSVDMVMSQILLVHIKDPERALSEMVRVVKPGGCIICKEQDHYALALLRSYNSAWIEANFDIDTEILFKKVNQLCHEGRIKLGRGDGSIASRIPKIMCDIGLINVDIIQDSQVRFIHPPYDTPKQKHYVQMFKSYFVDEKKSNFWIEQSKENFLAGGGNEEEFELNLELSNKFRKILREQIEEERFYQCSPRLTYVIRGIKPE